MGIPAGLDPGAGRLVLSCSFLEPLPERLEQLRQAARETADWGPVPLLLESHGVLVLARRNLSLASVELPEKTRQILAEREAVLRQLDLRFRLTLERFLTETARDGIEVTLLKGASLALDLYPDSSLRSQGDLDLLVHPRDVRAARVAGGRCGLFLGEQALPVWWYRLTHFHLKLIPESPLLREVELHWALHHPSQLFTIRLEELLARRKTVEVTGVPVWTLDPLDRVLHLVTHLSRHYAQAPGKADRELLVVAASTPGHAIRLKWILDVRSEVERIHDSTDPLALLQRAREWNAARELCWALRWIREALELAPTAEAWIESLLGALGPQPPMAGTHGGVPVERSSLQIRPLPTLDFRVTALRRFPRWFFPPRRFFERGNAAGERVTPLILRRCTHAARVLARSLLGLAAFPVAILAGVLSRPARRRARREAQAPEHVLELAAAARTLARTGECARGQTPARKMP